jgi:hypothetical protein
MHDNHDYHDNMEKRLNPQGTHVQSSIIEMTDSVSCAFQIEEVTEVKIGDAWQVVQQRDHALAAVVVGHLSAVVQLLQHIYNCSLNRSKVYVI